MKKLKNSLKLLALTILVVPVAFVMVACGAGNGGNYLSQIAELEDQVAQLQQSLGNAEDERVDVLERLAEIKALIEGLELECNATIQCNTNVTVNCNPTVTVNCACIYLFTLRINYNAGGGTGTMDATQHSISGSLSFIENTGFTRTGWTFVGWSVDSLGKGWTSRSQVISAVDLFKNGATTEQDLVRQVTLTAMWEANLISLRYHAGGGEGSRADEIHAFDRSPLTWEHVYFANGAFGLPLFTCPGLELMGYEVLIELIEGIVFAEFWLPGQSRTIEQLGARHGLGVTVGGTDLKPTTTIVHLVAHWMPTEPWPFP